MNLNIYKSYLLFVLILISSNIYSDEKITPYARIDLASRWLWRGIAYSATPVLQPSVGISNQKFNANIWGNYAFGAGENSEIDIFAEYKLNNWLKVGFTDFFGIADSVRNKQNFMNFNRETTTHLIDLFFVLTPFEKIPLSFTTSVWVWGAYRNETSKAQRYSSYLELAYLKSFENFDLNFFAGGTPTVGFYANKATIINTGIAMTKEIELAQNVKLPLKVEFVYNPHLQNMFLNGMVSIIF
jgi:hypothetical protein